MNGSLSFSNDVLMIIYADNPFRATEVLKQREKQHPPRTISMIPSILSLIGSESKSPSRKMNIIPLLTNIKEILIRIFKFLSKYKNLNCFFLFRLLFHNPKENYTIMLKLLSVTEKPNCIIHSIRI